MRDRYIFAPLAKRLRETRWRLTLRLAVTRRGSTWWSGMSSAANGVQGDAASRPVLVLSRGGCVRIGYGLSASGFLLALLLIVLSVRHGYDPHTPPAASIGDFGVDLLNRSSRRDDFTETSLTACIVIYNNGEPYFGSLLGPPSPTTNFEFLGSVGYVRVLGWDDGYRWITVVVNLWWLVVASLAFPVVRSFGVSRFRFRSSLRAVAIGATLMCLASAIARNAIWLHPLWIAMFMLGVLVGDVGCRSLAWLRQRAAARAA